MGDELKNVMHFAFRGGNSLHDDYCQVKGQPTAGMQFMAVQVPWDPYAPKVLCSPNSVFGRRARGLDAVTTRKAPGNMCTGACKLILHSWFAQELMTFPHFQCRDKHRCRSSFKHCLRHFQHSPRYDSIMPSPLAIGAGCLGRWS